VTNKDSIVCRLFGVGVLVVISSRRARLFRHHSGGPHDADRCGRP
jgi:hypothetical protein